jgi:GTPase SAR1 family protein
MSSQRRKGSVRKIIFCGLDNSGKSSFIARLKNQNYPMNLTPGVERTQYEVFGFPILIWDFGGQKKVRESYLEKTHFFDETDVVFYLIDIQAESRIDESLDFLKTLLKILTMKPIIMVCFHKADPDIAQSQKINKITETIKEQLKEYLKTFEHFFALTTIFDYISLLAPFSFALSKLLPFSAILDSYILDYFHTQQLACILLQDKGGAILSKATGDGEEGELDLAFCQLTGTHLTQLFESYEQRAMPIPDISIKLPGKSKRRPNAVILYDHISIYNKRYYLTILVKDVEQVSSLKDSLPEFIAGMSKTIELSF